MLIPRPSGSLLASLAGACLCAGPILVGFGGCYGAKATIAAILGLFVLPFLGALCLASGIAVGSWQHSDSPVLKTVKIGGSIGVGVILGLATGLISIAVAVSSCLD